MAQIPQQWAPRPGERGLVSHDPTQVAADALGAWDALLRAAEAADLRAPARAHGWTGIEALLPFGDWPENRMMSAILEDARNGRTGTVDQADDVRRVHAAHPTATSEEAIAAVRRSRDDLARWIEAGGPQEEGLLPTRSLLGTLPVLTLVHATAFQLAVSARDLVPCGAPPDAPLTVTGLTALVDTTGALAARQSAAAVFTVRTPGLALATASEGGDWRTTVLDAGAAPTGPGISAEAGTVIDIASGRVNVPALYASGEVRVHDLPGLLALAPVLEGVPGIPAGPALARAAKVLGGVGGLLGGLGGLLRRG